MKTFTKKLGMLCAATLVLACAAGAWWYSRRYNRFPAHWIPPWHAFEAFRQHRTRDDLAAATKALNEFFRHYQKLPFNSPDREYQFSVTLGHELHGVSPGTGRKNRDGIVFWNLPAGQQRDGWGNCYHFYFDHDADGLVHPGGVEIKRPFVIWSDGPNKQDESGNGDDLRNW